MFLEPEYQEPYAAWRSSPSEQTSSQLLGKLQPVIDSAVKSYGGTRPSPMMNSRARLLALSALEKYDPSRAKLRTHLLSNLQTLRRYAARESLPIRMPDRVLTDLYSLSRSENDLRDRLGRDPSTAELADHTGMPIRRIAKIRGIRPPMLEGQAQMLSSSPENPGGQLPAVVQQDQSHWHDFVYHDLDATDQLIMEHTLGLHGKPILEGRKIAAKLRITPSAVSQRAKRIQDKLDQREQLGLL